MGQKTWIDPFPGLPRVSGMFRGIGVNPVHVEVGRVATVNSPELKEHWSEVIVVRNEVPEIVGPVGMRPSKRALAAQRETAKKALAVAEEKAAPLAKPRGRPKKDGVRPWEAMDPPISKTEYYRRRSGDRKKGGGL